MRVISRRTSGSPLVCGMGRASTRSHCPGRSELAKEQSGDGFEQQFQHPNAQIPGTNGSSRISTAFQPGRCGVLQQDRRSGTAERAFLEKCFPRSSQFHVVDQQGRRSGNNVSRAASGADKYVSDGSEPYRWGGDRAERREGGGKSAAW